MSADIDADTVSEVVMSSVDEINAVIPPEMRLVKKCETPLFGEGRKIDSLGLVTLLGAIEQNLKRMYDKRVNLEWGSEDGSADGPFATLGSLIDHVTKTLRQS